MIGIDIIRNNRIDSSCKRQNHLLKRKYCPFLDWQLKPSAKYFVSKSWHIHSRFKWRQGSFTFLKLLQFMSNCVLCSVLVEIKDFGMSSVKFHCYRSWYNSIYKDFNYFMQWFTGICDAIWIHFYSLNNNFQIKLRNLVHHEIH
jgi:hypothetical protein